MSNKIQTIFATFITIIGISLTGFVAYFTFVFPKTIKIWSDQGRALTVFEKLLCNFSNLCTMYSLLLIPLSIMVIIAGFIWLILSFKGSITG